MSIQSPLVVHYRRCVQPLVGVVWRLSKRSSRGGGHGWGRRWTSTSTTQTTNNSHNKPASEQQPHKLRIAVVGGGCAGLSSALHLAPLVEQGYVAAPIDIYEAHAHSDSNASSTTTTPPRQAIGVGVWSTALDPFLVPTTYDFDQEPTVRTSHEMVVKAIHKASTAVGDAGYRTPDGTWLLQSHLPTTAQERAVRHNMPALYFLPQMELIEALQTAVQWEELQQPSTIRLHQGLTVQGIDEEPSTVYHTPWSARLRVLDTATSSTATLPPNPEEPANTSSASYLTEQDYHLIVVADGTHSLLRQRYGGYHLHLATQQRLIGTAGLPSQNDDVRVLPQEQLYNNDDDDLHLDATRLQDRQYTVFRGNAPLTNVQAMGEEQAGMSFQTWGTRDNMRFASVPMSTLKTTDAHTADNAQQQQPTTSVHHEECQVWFATIRNDELTAEPDPVRRQEMLVQAFGDWHDPIPRLIQSTPAANIVMDRAVAHKHCIGPAVALQRVLPSITGDTATTSSSPSSAGSSVVGQGPCMVFVGDAYMTIDPILAQGITVAMEGAAATRAAVQKSCKVSDPRSNLAFDPYLLRKELMNRHENRMDRLTCLLRATELVQALGQPQGGSLSGALNTYGLRPLTRLTPNFIKQPTFNAVLKYSLGLSPFNWTSKKPVTTSTTAKKNSSISDTRQSQRRAFGTSTSFSAGQSDRHFSSALPVSIEEEDDNLSSQSADVSNASTQYETTDRRRPRLQELREKLQKDEVIAPKDAAFSATAPKLRLPKESTPTSTDGYTRDDWLALLDVLPDVPADATALTDRFDRTHNYLRLSLAERCNLRCTYCMPADGVPLQPAHHLLQTEELLHLASFFTHAGVTKFRLTGGEPTLRADVVDIVQGLSDLGPRQIGMTTNGVALASKVPALVDAGLNSINVSLDTLHGDKWEALTRRPVTYLHKVLESLEACHTRMPSASQIKINCVLQRDVNTDEVADFISMGIERFPGIAVRFIEYMPFTDNGWELDKLVPYREVLSSLEEQQQHDWQFAKVPQNDPHDTTQWYKAWQDEDRFVNLGFITSMSRPFCAGCNRLRLSADGQLKVCLFGSTIHPHPAHLPSLWSLRDALRVGQLDDAQLGKLVYAALQTKERALGGHASPQMIHEHARENKPMTLIGG